MKMDSLEAGRRNTRGRGASAKRSKAANNNRSSTAAQSSKRRSSAKSAASSRGKASRGRPRTQGAAKSTTDLDEIRRWTEERGGKPVTVVGTAARRKAGLLRIDFPGYSGAGRLQEISWDDWYKQFNESELEFLYQDKPESRFFKLVARGTSQGKNSSRNRSPSKRRSRSAR